MNSLNQSKKNYKSLPTGLLTRQLTISNIITLSASICSNDNFEILSTISLVKHGRSASQLRMTCLGDKSEPHIHIICLQNLVLNASNLNLYIRLPSSLLWKRHTLTHVNECPRKEYFRRLLTRFQEAFSNKCMPSWRLSGRLKGVVVDRWSRGNAPV